MLQIQLLPLRTKLPMVLQLEHTVVEVQVTQPAMRLEQAAQPDP